MKLGIYEVLILWRGFNYSVSWDGLFWKYGSLGEIGFRGSIWDNGRLVGFPS